MQEPGVIADTMRRSPRWIDVLSELTGWYRLTALLRGNRIALGAVVKSPSRLTMGRGVEVQVGSLLHGGGRAWSGHRGHLHLADGVRVGPGCVIYASGGVDIGRHTHLGPGVKLMSQSGRHSPSRESSAPDYNFDPITIGSGVWIGAGAVVVGGATIGRCATVAPNSVVSGAVPDFAVVVGNPARVMFRNPENGL